jgi:Arf-GAP/coiled-coil/ANK repeat/PH domain-containing protein
LKQIKDTKKQFDRITNELDNAFVKNADAPKNKPIVCDELERNLLGIKKSFGHSTLEYICLLNKFYLGRSHSILDMVGYFLLISIISSQIYSVLLDSIIFSIS